MPLTQYQVLLELQQSLTGQDLSGINLIQQDGYDIVIGDFTSSGGA